MFISAAACIFMQLFRLFSSFRKYSIYARIVGNIFEDFSCFNPSINLMPLNYRPI